MRGFNKAIIVGNLAKDPEVRYTTTKQAVAKLTVAVNRSWKDRDGAVKEACDFIPVVVWGPTAENAERYLKKGKPVRPGGRGINRRRRSDVRRADSYRYAGKRKGAVVEGGRGSQVFHRGLGPFL